MSRPLTQIYLYKCEECGVASFSSEDQGDVWYANCVGSCKGWMFHRKVIIRESLYLLPSIADEYMFMCKGEENEKGSNEESSK